jgi:hypothetical protein
VTDRRPGDEQDDSRPGDDAQEGRGTSDAPAADGSDDALEARDASDAPAADDETNGSGTDGGSAPSFEGGPGSSLEGGLRSASSIFGEAKLPDNWPTRREIRAAERAARESGEVDPVPPADDDAGDDTEVVDEDAADFVLEDAPGSADTDTRDVVAETAEVEPVAPSAERADEDDRTQAVSMPVELAKPGGPEVPPAAVVPPTSTSPHPMSIELPFAASSREVRAEETRAIDEERRRHDPDGVGRDDVDWLGRATDGASVPSDAEPPSFTELLRVAGSPGDAPAPASADAPFDWSRGESEPTGAVPEVPTASDPALSLDTTSLAVGGWSLSDEDDAEAEVVDGEQHAVPADASGEPSLEELLGVTPPAASDEDDDWDDDDDADAADGAEAADRSESADLVDPTTESSWSLSDEAARTGELFVGDTMDPPIESPADRSGGTPTPTADPAPPLVAPDDEPAPHLDADGHVPPAVGADLDAVDQQEWDGRETSDTRAIDALFGTGAMQAVDEDALAAGPRSGAATSDEPEHDYLDDDDDLGDGETGTRMMPTVGQLAADDSTPNDGRTGGAQDVRRPDGFPFPAAPVSAGAGPIDSRPVVPPRSTGVYGAPAPARTSDRGDNFVNEGFGRLAAQGQRGKRLLIWGAVGLIVVLLVLVFFITRWIIGGDPQNQPAPSPTKTSASASVQRSAAPSPSASSAPEPVATASFAATAAAPGEHSWRDLVGGECVNPFTDAWATTVTVVDCAGEHAAQMTHRATIDQADYPGADALRAQMATTCSGSGALNLTAAANYSDIQVQGSYPADVTDWDAGDHFWYCFVSRSSGQPLTGSLAPAA